jgi:hypothetical protein
MPTYTFRNKKTNEVTELVMKMAELDSYREANPDLETIISAPWICDPVRVGARKPDTGFKEVLQKIHERTPGSTLNQGSVQL